MEMSIKERVVDHTTKMFARNGVKSVRMDDIAAEMGISKRTIYEIFGDKENLIMDCLTYFYEQIHCHTERITEGASNIIEEYLMMLDEWDKQADATYNMMHDVKKFYPKIYERYTDEHMDKGAEHIRQKLRRGIEEGYLLESINVDLSISMMGHAIYGILKKDAVLPADVTERDAFKYVISYFIRGIATLKGITLIDDYLEKKHNNR